jgi:regulator of protease activity HflC (stomatin/prohibitin superfamily)
MSTEARGVVVPGMVMLPIAGILTLGGLAASIWSGIEAEQDSSALTYLWIAIGAQVIGWILAFGFFTLQPNEARVLVFFGTYQGTVRREGFHWGNPFYSNMAVDPRRQETTEEKLKAGTTKRGGLGRFKVSLRARTLQGDHLKVNDRRGNPVEIGAMVVWRVTDTAKAVFDVDDFRQYVSTQAETALRHIATQYPYDQGGDEDAAITLRGNPDEVAGTLREDLERRLSVAGVTVEDTRLTHLAYAPEIAQAMLRRQQAEAVIAARRKIVHGAVSMVDMAVTELSGLSALDMTDEAKADMVGNLMVVLCGEADVQPVLNTGR